MAASAPTTSSTPPAGAESLHIRVRDGLRLHVRRHGLSRHSRPVLCLPGLTRNGRDFAVLAEALAADARHPRTVYALDYRGRGFSDHDADWKNYTVPVEAQDVVDVMAALGIHGAALVGTSRGGLIAMVLGALQPTAFGPVVLNDIGPVIEREGLARIAAYVGRTPVPQTWEEAARLLREQMHEHFPAVPEDDYLAIARQLYNDRDGRPAAGYDDKLARTFSLADGPPPALWPQFQTLAKKPLMVIRGERSDLLAQETVEEILKRHGDARALTVAGQGHAPLLRDAATIAAIATFLAETDGAH